MTRQLFIYDVIGQVTAKDVSDFLREVGPDADVDVHVASPGGNWDQGVAMHNLLARHAGRVRMFVDALAASAAAYLILAGDEIHIAANAELYYHEPYTESGGDAHEHSVTAARLQRVRGLIIDKMRERTGLEDDTLSTMLQEGTYFAAAEAVANGLADSIVDDVEFDETFAFDESSLTSLEHVPDCVLANLAQPAKPKRKPARPARQPAKEPVMSDAKATFSDLKSALPNADNDFLAQHADQSTVAEATLAFADHAAGQAEEARAKLAEAQNELSELKAAKPKKDPPGTKGVKGSQGGDDDEVPSFTEIVAEFEKQGMDKTRATRAAIRKSPESHRAYVETFNHDRGRKSVELPGAYR